MGQQQLLLIGLGVIVVGIAVAVGITLFRSQSSSSNRDNLIDDLVRYSAYAQEYYMRPQSLAGGGGSFMGFALSPQDTGNADGSFAVRTSAPFDADPVAGSTTAVGTQAQTIYIIGYGKEIGNNDFQNVKAYATVTADTVYVKIKN